MNNKTKKLTITALMMAVICLSTMFLGFPIFYGYANLGDGVIYLAGFLLGPKYGFIAAALGASIADYSLSYTQYIITSFFVKGFMALLAGKARNRDTKYKVFNCVIGGFVMVLGYYITEVIIYGSKVSPLVNIPINCVQFIIGIVISIILFKQLKQLKL